MSLEHPVRFPPPLARSIDVDGVRVPVVERPVIECGARAELGGVPVACTRENGHPVRINFAHTNGYAEWCFD